MTEQEQIKQWMDWYLQPPINVFEVYGDALEFTAEEKAMSAILRKAQKELTQEVMAEHCTCYKLGYSPLNDYAAVKQK